jgi:hypothetical protein
MKKTTKVLLAVAAGSLLASQQSQAGISYSDGDLLLGFYTSPSSQDLQVDLGSVSTITSLFGSGSTVSFSSKFTLTDLTTAFNGVGGTSGFDNVNFSVTAVKRTGNATYNANTLWATEARSDPNTPTSPYTRFSSSVQGNTGSKIASLGNNMNGASGTSSSPNSAIIVSPGAFNAYEHIYGTSGNIGGTFQASVEATTPAPFTAPPVRLDMYELLPNGGTVGTAGSSPTSGSGLYLGFFDLNSSGVLTFTAVPEASTYAAMIAGGLMLLSLYRVHRFSAAS